MMPSLEDLLDRINVKEIILEIIILFALDRISSLSRIEDEHYK